MAGRGRELHILLAGAGPVGLLVAAQLARQGHAGLRIRVVASESPPHWQAGQMDARVYALSRESQFLLGAAWSAIAARRVCPYERMRVFAGEDPEAGAAIDFQAADIGEADLGHIVEDSLLRMALLEELDATAVEIELGTSVASLDRAGGRIRVGFGDGSTELVDLVIGADGAGSRVRTAAGIEIWRKDYFQRALVTHVVTGKEHAATAWQRFLPDGPLAFLPLADGRSSVVWSTASDRTERLLGLPEGEFLAELETASAGVLGQLASCTARMAFPLELRHALRYTAPGIVLVGDAAHTVHPLAGQGMNLGLRDAAALVNVLNEAIAAGEYPGDELVLRRYARAQRAHNLAMQLAFDSLNTLFGRRLPAWLAPLRALGMAAVDHAPPAKQLLMRRALGLDGSGFGRSGTEAA